VGDVTRSAAQRWRHAAADQPRRPIETSLLLFTSLSLSLFLSHSHSVSLSLTSHLFLVSFPLEWKN
jgi:hypothetical protein